ncbi:unnamed protein product, partial [Nippostrongylus brasiliensis]|uniref:R3H domain-containing protein n=1 Tax=Nippostrongylus brasiliensis TaxID=27835 RepID=A0A0N4XG94_NIPBR
CDKVCNRLLACGEHRCTQICHEGDCSPCEVTFVQKKKHRCRALCHSGDCPPCELTTSVICRCKQVKRTLPCSEYVQFADGGEFLCERRCKKRKSCGIHKCQELCCVQSEHLCLQVCNKRLSCGLHLCESICHAGLCPRCLNSSFEEQYCHCGRTMRPPPVPCGAPLPECYEPCARPHSCNHPVTHRCHGEERCPPCTALVERMCYGKHEEAISFTLPLQLRKNIPCHIDAVSCGRLCDKPLGCGVHNCTRNCHAGDCMKEGEKCTKPCKVLRQSCEHPCALPCHGTEPCPESECRFPLNVTCECGKRKSILKCSEFEKVIARLRAVEAEDSEGDPSNTAAGVGTLKRSASTEKLNCLPCDDDCKKVARNKKLAEALQLVTDENGMLEREPTITFTEYMKAELRTNAAFVCEIEKTFMELLEKIEDPTFLGSSLNHNFRPMSVELRRFIHEYAEFFSIDTVSVDDPPKRSIIATAKRGISRAPLVLLTSLQKYPNMLKSSGSVTLKSGFGDDSKKKSEQSEQESSSTSSMKALRGARLFKKRVAPQIARPSPLPQFNHFAVLLSDDEDTPSPQANQTSRPAPYQNLMLEKDPDWWSDDEEPLSGESGEYDEIESLMNDLVLEVCKSEEPDTCKNCKDSWSDDE